MTESTIFPSVKVQADSNKLPVQLSCWCCANLQGTASQDGETSMCRLSGKQ